MARLARRGPLFYFWLACPVLVRWYSDGTLVQSWLSDLRGGTLVGMWFAAFALALLVKPRGSIPMTAR